jgi:hypothetical protein
MSSAIEVIKNIKCLDTGQAIITRVEQDALDEAIVALKQKENDRKQGALEELERLYKSISVFHVEDCIELKLIEKRIKELEGEGVEKK